jgi:inner membrane protein
MDNFSHSVAGLAAGELVHRSLPPESDSGQQRLRRRLLLISCWLASNFPDLDLVLTPLMPAPLGYLLHHRGHTHTVLYAFPQALLLSVMIWFFWPSARRLLKASAVARTGFFLTLCLGFGFHLLMDYLNSYGIHPFHPFDSRWLYGDMVFILEPFFWVAFGVPMIMSIERPTIRVLFIALLAGILLFFSIRGFLAWPSLFFLVMLGLILGSTRHNAGMSALLLAAIASIGFIGMQNFASAQARLALMAMSKNKNPANRMLDASMSPFPTNPFCWAFVTVESNDAADTYLMRRGILSLAPVLLPVSQCPAGLSERTLQKEVTPAMALLLEQEGKRDILRGLKRDNCHFEAWLRFARAPLVDPTRASDIRFSSSPRGNFTTMNFDDFKDRPCPPYIPAWDFPRADLLEQARHPSTAK